MITVYGEGRGFLVVWLLEEMRLPYHLRQVDLLKGVENDPDFLAINPGGFIPALRDGDVLMVESVAIIQYLTARYGPTPLAPATNDPAFPLYLQFLLLGEAGLMAMIYPSVVTRNAAPEGQRDNWTTAKAVQIFESRLGWVTRQLAKTAHIAGDSFTAADIVVTHALEFAFRTGFIELGAAEHAYIDRMRERDGYRRAMAACPDTRAWDENVRGHTVPLPA